MKRSFSRDPKVDRSLRHSVRDGVAYSVMAGGGESYFSAFSIFFKATALDIGILSSVPALIGSFFQLLSLPLGRQAGSRRRVIMVGANLQVFSWLPLTLLPFLFPKWALVIILASLILFYAAGNLVTPQWTSLMGDLVPERQRGRFFAHRSRLSSVTGLMALVAGGLILQVFSTSTAAKVGFVSIFAIAAVARIFSAYHLSQMYEPPLEQHNFSVAEWLRRWWSTPVMHFTRFYALMQFSVAIAGPFFTVYMLRDLHFTYLQFMVNTAVSTMVQFLTLRMWGRVGDAFGNRPVLVFCGFSMATVPALWLFSGNFWYLLAAQAFSGWVWGGFTLSAGNILFDLVPRRDRPGYLACHNVSGAVGTFVGALVGGWFVVTVPGSTILAGHGFHVRSVIVCLFLLSSVARLLTAAGFLPGLKESRRVRPFSWRALAFRITGSRRWLTRLAGRGVAARRRHQLLRSRS